MFSALNVREWVEARGLVSVFVNDGVDVVVG
jgi:hypothetical protein